MSSPQPLDPHTAHAGHPRLDVAYADAGSTASQLADPRVLAVFGFGDAAVAVDDPRWLRVPLQPLLDDAPRIEVWRAQGVVTHGREDEVAWASDGRLLFGAIEVDEDECGIEAAATHAYARIARFLSGHDMPHLLRMWNYMDAITLGEGDDERYRRFCVGRAAGLGGIDVQRLPAATAIGRCDGRRRLQVYWLAARSAGTPVENPRQLSAWRYPRLYGPQAPSFARAMLPPADAAMPLLLSGTAAIIGHASQHDGSVQAQVDETLANIHSLIDAARLLRPCLPAVPGAATPLKVYVRDPRDAQAVAATLAQRLDPAVPRLLLHARVCRRELLVEIDGAHAAPPPA